MLICYEVLTIPKNKALPVGLPDVVVLLRVLFLLVEFLMDSFDVSLEVVRQDEPRLAKLAEQLLPLLQGRRVDLHVELEVVRTEEHLPTVVALRAARMVLQHVLFSVSPQLKISGLFVPLLLPN